MKRKKMSFSKNKKEGEPEGTEEEMGWEACEKWDFFGFIFFIFLSLYCYLVFPSREEN